MKLKGFKRKLKQNRLTAGNVKLSKKILIFNLPSGKQGTCPITCNSCYSLRTEKRWPNVKVWRNENLQLAKHNLPVLEECVHGQLYRSRKSIVRIHEGGDFFSQPYLDMWSGIATSFPDNRFYAYTKTLELFNFSRFSILPNVNIINSHIEGNINYGSLNYCNSLVEEYGAFLCPATLDKHLGRKRKTVCGEDCTYCITEAAPVFLKH